MATAAAVDAVDDHRPDENNKKRSRPPNRRKHEEQLEEIMNQIRPLEDRLKSMGRPPNDTTAEEHSRRENLLSEQKRLRDEKEAAITKRKAMDQDLRDLNNKIGKMSDSLSKLEAGLKFKTQSSLESAIKKLEHQLQTRHFKYSEENRIVREIDSLRRSKKKVKEYQERRKEIDGERSKKAKLKSERDKYFFMVSTLKKKEDALKQQGMQLRSKSDEAWSRYRAMGSERESLRKEIDSLYEQKRQLIAEFRQQQNEYHEQAKIQRAESLRKREEEKKAFIEAKQKAWDAYEASLEPYEEERHMCSALIKYLLKFQTPDHIDVHQDVSPVPSPVTPNPPSSLKEDHREFTVLKKKGDDEDDVFLANSLSGKKRRSGRRPRKSSWLNKPLRHTAQAFSQFASLDLTAPTTAADLPDVLEQLYAKKQQFKEFSRSAMTGDTYHKRHLSASSTLSTSSSQALSDVDSAHASNASSGQSDGTEDRISSNSETRTHIEEREFGGSQDCVDDGDQEREELKGTLKCKSVPKINTKLSALNISAAQSLHAKKTSEPVPSQSDSSELALPTHRLEPEATGDGSSSSATESTLPETPLSDMSAPFETSGEGLDSGIDENRGGKMEVENLNEENELIGLEELSDSDLVEKIGDLNANDDVLGSTSEKVVNNSHNAMRDKQSCSIGSDIGEDIKGIHISQESESFHKQVDQREHSSPAVSL